MERQKQLEDDAGYVRQNETPRTYPSRILADIQLCNPKRCCGFTRTFKTKITTKNLSGYIESEIPTPKNNKHEADTRSKSHIKRD